MCRVAEGGANTGFIEGRAVADEERLVPAYSLEQDVWRRNDRRFHLLAVFVPRGKHFPAPRVDPGRNHEG